MVLARVVLVGSALAFAGIGIAFLLRPHPLLEVLGLVPSGALGVTDVRAVHGGLEVAIGAALAAGAARPAWVPLALRLQVLLFAGLLAGRIVGLLADGVPGMPGPVLAGLEAVALACGLVAWARLPGRRG